MRRRSPWLRSLACKPSQGKSPNWNLRPALTISFGLGAQVGLVSRVTPVQTAMRNCTRDEGRSFEVGNQVLISNHRKLLWPKAMVVNVAEKLERDSGRYDWERRAQANRCRSVESGLDDAKTGG